MQEEIKNGCDHHEHDEEHCHEHGADHDHAHTHEHGHEHTHTHEHEHTHTHEHTHADGVTHTHEHGHTHSHSHEHPHHHEHGHRHSHGGGDAFAETLALLDYMAHHNKQHADELAEMGEKLREMGKAEAADKIAEAVEDFSKSNGKLEEALEIVKKLQ